MRIDIVTTFPEMFSPDAPAALGVSIPARAYKAGVVQWHATDIRAHTLDKHQKTDDRPFGGGPGMVMMCQPLWDAVRTAEALDPRPATRLLMSPQGRPFSQAMAEELSRLPRLLIIAGHYEGIDERVIQRLAPIEVSVGDYVLSSGELAAMVVMDAVIRLLPGALGDEASAVQDSFAAPHDVDAIGKVISAKVAAELGVPPGARLLDCPHYTRPREWEGMEVPETLLSGDHQAVAKWRLQQRLARTKSRRPDLLGPK